MKKLNILLLSLLTISMSCSSDDDSSSPNMPRLVEVTELITQNGQLTDFGPQTSVVYQYNSNGFISSIISSAGTTKTFNYNTNNQLTSETFSNTNGDSYQITYTYENGVITKEEYSNGDYVEFVYDGDELVQQFYFYTNSDNNGSITLTNDTNGNVITITRDADATVLETYEYDSKINPFYSLYPEAYCKIKRISPNNMTFRSQGNRQISYEYNSLNLPIESVYLDSGAFRKDTNYFYN